MQLPASTRAVSSVVSVLLLVAVVVVLAATVSVFTLGIAETQSPGPVINQSSGEIIADRPGADDQKVRITHVAGDTVAVFALEIAVQACGRSARLVNLPAPTTRAVSTRTFFPLDEGNFEGNQPLLSEGTVGQSWDSVVLHEDTTNRFRAGTTIAFRINNDACSLDTSDQVDVRVIHTPTNSIPIRKELTVSWPRDQPFSL